MIKRFLFDGIDMNGCRASINEAPELPADIDTGTAPAPLTIFDNTVLGAEEALDKVSFVTMGLTFCGDRRGVAASAVLAGQGNGGPESGSGGLADQFIPGIGSQGRIHGMRNDLGKAGQGSKPRDVCQEVASS